ncbi:MAG TPA: abortive phage infection protein [Candidatus Scybalocola faecigallinarum]|uniref:Abortive phage infection protein n=1 Tax=Candidatus Scybalocola faecigallinarum TaxID=2840941 RepID=A0A9D1F6W2_9FIRM|nr:abortive phage infection protein [Candidatus Scybalocola faecigallinarum]
MSKKEILKTVIENNGGIAKTSDFAANGINKYEVAAFCKDGYSDFSPREWSIAVPRTASRAVKNIEEFPMKAYYIQKDFFDIGKSTSNFNGIILPVYDRERTICDCFKYRTKLDNEIFNKAVNAYASDEKKNLANLSKYAKEMKLYTKVMNVMEVLLNG